MFDTGEFNIGMYSSTGSWTWQEELLIRYASWMKERGSRIVLFCVDNSPLYHHAKEQRLRVERIQRNKKYGDRKNARKLAVKFENNKLDIIWVYDSWDISIAGLAKSLCKRRLTFLYQQSVEIKSAKRDFVHTKRFNRIDIWVSPLKHLIEQVKKKTKFPEEKLHLVRIPVNIQELMFHNLPREQARFEMTIDPSAPLFGIKGTINPRQGQVFVTIALAELRKKFPNLQLLIYGQKGKGEAESYYDELKETIRRYRLEGAVHVRENMDNEASFFRAIDVFISPDKNDVAGTDTIKAMLFGNKVIGVNEGGVPELLEWGEFGELYTPNNYFEFGQAYESVLADMVRAEEKARNAASEAKERYDHYFACDVIENLLRESLKSKEV